MTYEANVEFKFDSSYKHTYSAAVPDDDFLPEEHFIIKAPAADLNIRQYFKLFEKFMLGVGMSPNTIRSGAMSLVFNDWVGREDQLKACREYNLTMDEDLRDKFNQWKKDEEFLNSVCEDVNSLK